MAKQLGGGIFDTLQANWTYVLGALLAVIILYWVLFRRSFTPKVKEGMGGCSKCPKRASAQMGQ
jgi:hypothetical protein